MSIERLNMLKSYLNRKGWKVLNEFEESGLPATFEINNESIQWTLQHFDPKVSNIELEFTLMRNMGEYTEDVNDVWWCKVKGGTQALFFSKINTESWRIDYKDFVDSLIEQV